MRPKQEVAPAETARQCQAYLQTIQALKNGVVLDATQPPEKVAAVMHASILNFMAQRTANGKQ